jgi:nucleotide-binding universal stress UspA family protein
MIESLDGGEVDTMTARPCIVHPTDFSPASDPAFVKALEAAKRDGAELLLVHVLEPISAFSDEAYLARRLEVREASATVARQGFEVMLARAKDAEVPATEVLLDGWPPEQIANIAKERGAVLIVMGTHGRTGVRKLLLGSVAERVVAMAPCPVLTVRAQ